MPLRSMTGFGQAETATPSGIYHIEIRGVNNRFLETQIRTPKFLSNLESKIKQAISSGISRGSVQLFITCNGEETRSKLVWDKEAVNGYMKIFREIQKSCGLQGDITMSDLLGFSDLIKTQATLFNDETLWEQVKPILEKAMRDFQKSREREAAQLEIELRKMLKIVQQTLKKVEKRAPLRLSEYRAALGKRIEELLKDQPDPARIAQEAAIMADRLDITEECQRLNAHIEKFTETFKADEPVGKRMNFLLQEMNREANTIGSKANDTEISHLSVSLKEFIEKIREQIQNIE